MNKINYKLISLEALEPRALLDASSLVEDERDAENNCIEKHLFTAGLENNNDLINYFPTLPKDCKKTSSSLPPSEADRHTETAQEAIQVYRFVTYLTTGIVDFLYISGAVAMKLYSTYRIEGPAMKRSFDILALSFLFLAVNQGFGAFYKINEFTREHSRGIDAF